MCSVYLLCASALIVAMVVGDAVIETNVIAISVEGFVKQPWFITTFQVHDGCTFIELSKKDTGFQRFVFGGYKKGAVRDCRFLDELRKLRQHTCLSQRLETEASVFAGRDTRHVATKKRRQARAGIEPTTNVHVTMPSFTMDDGTCVDEVTCTMQWSLDFYAPLTVSLEANVLTYIRHAMHHSIEEDTKKRNKPSVVGKEKMYRWVEKQSVFRAQRERNGKTITCIFRPAGKSDAEIADARDQAEAWAMNDGDDFSPFGENGDDMEDDADDDSPEVSAPSMFSIS